MVQIEIRNKVPANAIHTENHSLEIQVEEYFKSSTYLKKNIKTLNLLVWRQYTDMLQQKVEQLTGLKKRWQKVMGWPYRNPSRM